MAEFLRAFRAEEVNGEAGTPIRFTASTEGVKRDGRDLRADRWRLENYRANPVVLWTHDYMGRTLPIARAEVEVSEGRLVAEVKFDQEDDFARQVESKYRRGFLNAVSVGWENVQQNGDEWYDLLDISAVPVPGDPEALMERQRAWREWEERIAPGRTTVGNWLEAGIHSDFTMRADLLFSEGIIDREERIALSAAIGEGLTVFAGQLDKIGDLRDRALVWNWARGNSEGDWRVLAAEMVGLYVAVSDDDASSADDGAREAQYRALLPRYRRLGRTPPEFLPGANLAALGAAELRGLFLEGEPEMVPALFEEVNMKQVGALSAEGKERLARAGALIHEVLESVATEAEPDENEEGEERVEVEALTRLHDILTGGNDDESDEDD